MKKITALLLAIIMCVSLLAACDDKKIPSETTGTGENTENVTTAPIDIPDVPVDFAAFEKDPYGAISTAFENSFGLSSEDGTTNDTPETILVDFNLDALDTYKVNLSTVANTTSGAFAGKLGVDIGGMAANLSAWYDGKALALSLPEVLGDGIYGIDIENLEADFPQSPLFEGMTLEEFIDTVVSSFNEGFKESAGMDFEAFLEMFKEQENLENELLATFSQELMAVLKDCQIATEKVSWTEGGASVEASKATCTLTAMDITKILASFEKFAEGFGTDISTEEDMKDLFEEAENTDAKLIAEIWLNNVTGTVMQVKLTATGGTLEKDVVIDLILGEDIRKSTNVLFSVTGPEDTDFSVSIVEITEEGLGGFTATVVLGGETMGKVTFKRNLSNGEYNLEIVSEGKTVFAVFGTYIEDDISFWLSVDSVKYGDVTVDLECSLSVMTVGTVQSVPEYTNILKMSKLQLALLSERIQKSDLVITIASIIESMQSEVPSDEYTEENLREELIAGGYTDEAMIEAYIDYTFGNRDFEREELREMLEYFDYSEEDIEYELEWYFYEDDLRAALQAKGIPDDVIDDYIDFVCGYEEFDEEELRELLHKVGYTDQTMLDLYMDYYFDNRKLTENELRSALTYFDYYEEDIEYYVYYYFYEDNLRAELSAQGIPEDVIQDYIDFDCGYRSFTEEELRELLPKVGYSEEDIEQVLEYYFYE